MKLYKHQKEVIDEVESELMFGENQITLDLCPSFGKSIVACWFIMHHTVDKTLISLSFSALIDQFIETFESIGFTDYTVCKAGHSIPYDETKRVCIGMDNSVHSRYLSGNINLSTYDILLSDESHVRVEAKRYQSIKNAISPEIELLMSGTPYTSEGFKLSNTTISVASADELTEKKYLTQIEYVIPKLNKDLAIEGISKSGGEYNQEELSSIFGGEDYMKSIAKEYIECDLFEPRTDKSIWFCTTVEQCDILEKELQSLGLHIFSYHSKTSNQDAIMDSFRGNKPMSISKDINLLNNKDYIEKKPEIVVKGLISVAKLSIGFSVSDIKIGVMTSKTLIRSKYVQQVMRLARTHESKSKAYLLDFGLNSELHGSATQKFSGLEKDCDDPRHEMAKLGWSNVKEFCNNRFEVFNQQRYDDLKAKIIDDDRRYSTRSVDELKQAFVFETDVFKILGIYMTFFYKVHAQDGYKDKWGNSTHGYTYEKFDRDNPDVPIMKDVVGFFKPSTLDWISKPWVDVFSSGEYSDKVLRKWTKSLKTRCRSLVNKKGSIYQIRFFIDLLVESEEKSSIMAISEQEQKILDFNHNEPKSDIPQSTGSYEIEIDSEIPF